MNARQATLAHAQLRTPRAAAVRVCRFAPAEGSQNWLGKDQYGTDSLGRDYRACRFSAGTRRLEARAADADANGGPDSSRAAAGALVLLAVGMTSREVRSGLAVRTDHHFRRQAHLIWLSVYCALADLTACRRVQAEVAR